jgi:hypothetical protein
MPQKFRHVVRVDDAQKIDVIVAVEARHLIPRHRLGAKHLHLSIEAVVHNQVVGHAYAVRLHWMSLPVVIVPDLGFMKRKIGTAK